MDKLKYIKLENEDGSYSNSIPLAVDGDHVDVNGDTLTNELSKKASIDLVNSNTVNLQNQINSLASGSPLAASSVSEMTDTSRIYVNTTDGFWYYYNGTNWVAGDVYQTSVSSSEVASLNDNMKNFYYNINGTSSSSALRHYLQYNFIEDIIYKLKVKFNSITPTSSTTTINFALRLTSSETIDTIVQNLVLSQKKTDMQNEYEVTFRAPRNANYVYIYQQFQTGTTYDYDITITSPLGETNFDENKFFYDKDNKGIKEKSNIGKRFNQSISRIRTSTTERDFIPFSFKAGVKYYIILKINEYTASNSNVGLSLKTSLAKSSDSAVENISGDIPMGNINKRYDYELNCNYDANYLYIYTGFLTNTEFDIDIIILESYEDLTFDENDFFYDRETKKMRLIGAERFQYSYLGKKIDLSYKGFNCVKYMDITTKTTDMVQGMAIHNGKMFQCQNKGILNVYDLDNKNGTPLATCNLGSYSETDNHANCCNFSNKYYNNNTIPLLYVTGGNSGNVMECDVENIILSENNGEYSVSSELIQRITLDQSNFESKELVPYWGWPCWLVSQDNKYLYCFGAKYRTNGSMKDYDDDNRYIITKFHYPDINNSDVVLTADDVLEQFTTSYEIDVTQGGTLHNDKIYYLFGFGNVDFPSKLGVWDLRNKSFASLVDFSNTPISNQEPEDVCTYENNLYVVTASKKVYKLEF